MRHVFRVTECLIVRTFILGRFEIRLQLRWSINVWCGIFNVRPIGPVFYEGTLTGQRYLELLQDVITDFLENLPLHQFLNVWFQHDGAPPHKISNLKQYLMETFYNQVMGYGGFVERPPRSPDLTTLDFFLWGHIKGQVYATLRQHCRIFDDALLMLMSP
ncbi:hypothetical protein AVEN_34565-1 [Araneus ventricosus]|uniref:Tc1-like transposase DDE domain-containing protein n=1 Tax=Araneus ventricosus TaxID=182803 RepID=A0A4Y2B2S6_ARAVE|nr:hypothetical protein AVEN_34565-1 [Araneus ventricosus]